MFSMCKKPSTIFIISDLFFPACFSTDLFGNAMDVQETIHIIQELCSGGSLRTALDKRTLCVGSWKNRFREATEPCILEVSLPFSILSCH
jgi:hypothetical protein